MLFPQVAGIAENFSIDGLETRIVSFQICDFLQKQFFAGFGMRLIATFEATGLASCAGPGT